MSTAGSVEPCRPLGIPELFARTFGVLRRRFWLFMLLGVIPNLVTGLVVILAASVLGYALTMAVGAAIGGRPSDGPDAGWISSWVVVVGFVLITAAQLKGCAMMTAAAQCVTRNTQPTLRGLVAQTRGFLRRMAPFIAAVTVLVGLLHGLGYLVARGLLMASATGSDVAGAALLATLVAAPLCGAAAVFVGTRLAYIVPVAALERAAGLDVVRRSFALTNGEFWRTLGRLLLGGLTILAFSVVVGLPAQVVAIALVAREHEAPTIIDLGFGMFAALFAVQWVVGFVTTPFLQIYVTHLFADRVFRSGRAAS